MVIDPLYRTKVSCLMCMLQYETYKVRPRFKKAIKVDSDFCGHYKDVNPDFYVVRICPQCGFACTENFSNQITKEQREIFNAKVASQWILRDYGVERTAEDAMKAYKLALLCAQIKQESPRIIAGLLHHIAWLYRYERNYEQELRFLQYTLEAYIQVYEREGAELNNAKLLYLIGELNRRTGHFLEAVKWFSRIINDKRISDASMIKMAREQWQETRENMQAIKLEMPDDMMNAN